MPCFVADSACTPRMLDCNPEVAARLAAFHGLDTGLRESNGWQHYRKWRTMFTDHTDAGAPWLHVAAGLIPLP